MGYVAHHGRFNLYISDHALQRLSERTGWHWDEQQRVFRIVARVARDRYDPDRVPDSFNVEVEGMVWVVAVTGRRRATVMTVMPCEWKERSYAMEDWL